MMLSRDTERELYLADYETPGKMWLLSVIFDDEDYTKKSYSVREWIDEIQDFVFDKNYETLEEAYLNYQIGILRIKQNAKSEEHTISSTLPSSGN